MSVCSSIGSPTRSACMRATNSSSNASATSSCTMKRLAAMQLCPLFCTRAVTAVCAAFSRSADGMTTNGIAAAELEHDRLELLPRDPSDRTAGGRAPGERRGAHARIAQDALDRRRADQQRLERAVGESGPPERVLDEQRGLRDVRRVLQQPDVARHQRGRREPDHLPQREVPRHHREHRTERLVAHVRARRADRGRVGRLVGEHRLRVLGVEAAALRALLHLGPGRDDRLAHLGRHDPGDLLDRRVEVVGRGVHPPGPVGEASCAGTRRPSPRPGRCARRPRRRRGPRRSSRSRRSPGSSSQWP